MNGSSNRVRLPVADRKVDTRGVLLVGHGFADVMRYIDYYRYTLLFCTDIHEQQHNNCLIDQVRIVTTHVKGC